MDALRKFILKIMVERLGYFPEGNYNPKPCATCIGANCKHCEDYGFYRPQPQDKPPSGSGEDKPRYYDAIAVDFDGTLCEYNFPDIGKLKPHVIEFVKQHAARGSKIILHTCRENGTRRALLDEAVAFCAAHAIPLYAVNENPENTYPEQYGVQTAGRKVYADLYIDDKAIHPTEIEKMMDGKGALP